MHFKETWSNTFICKRLICLIKQKKIWFSPWSSNHVCKSAFENAKIINWYFELRGNLTLLFFFFFLTDQQCIINFNNLYFKASASHACQPCHSLEELWPFNEGWAFPCSAFKQWYCDHVFTSDRWIYVRYPFLHEDTSETLRKFTFLNISKLSSTVTF